MTNSKRDSFCILPWIHLQVSPSGKMHSCCQTSFKNSLGNLNSSSVKEIFNGEKYKSLRQSMLSGEHVPECKNCYLSENLGIESLRQSSNKEYGQIHDFSSLTDEPLKPVFLDIRFDNLCNLKCRSCTPHYSTKWYGDFEKVTGAKFKPDFEIDTKEKIWNEFSAYFSTAQRIYFAGGEPLLSPLHSETLEYLLKCGNSSVGLTYNTNLTTIPDSVIKLWSKFKNVTVCASLDGAGAIGESIRFGSNWEQFIKNSSFLKMQLSHVTFRIDFTLSVYNIFYLPETLEELISRNVIDTLSNFTLNFLSEPKCLCVHILDQLERSKLKLKYAEFSEKFENKHSMHAEKYKNILNSALAYLQLHSSENERLDFKFYNRKLDQIRTENSLTVFKELERLIRI